MERRKIQPIDFSTKDGVKPNLNNVKPFTGKIPELPKKHKVSTMFKIKSKAAEWALGLIATLPEDFIYDLIKRTLQKLEKRVQELPKWAQLVYRLVLLLIAAVDKDSDGGRRITKEEVKGLVDVVWNS
jgi:hypothetical protein